MSKISNSLPKKFFGKLLINFVVPSYGKKKIMTGNLGNKSPNFDQTNILLNFI
jgi:hypothetical protein